MQRQEIRCELFSLVAGVSIFFIAFKLCRVNIANRSSFAHLRPEHTEIKKIFAFLTLELRLTQGNSENRIRTEIKRQSRVKGEKSKIGGMCKFAINVYNIFSTR